MRTQYTHSSRTDTLSTQCLKCTGWYSKVDMQDRFEQSSRFEGSNAAVIITISTGLRKRGPSETCGRLRCSCMHMVSVTPLPLFLQPDIWSAYFWSVATHPVAKDKTSLHHRPLYEHRRTSQRTGHGCALPKTFLPRNESGWLTRYVH